ncbi:uncharacterized protein DFL_009272 [Arthrobotrys flagrans]|uniref:Uncharacterized protein n=1 Tax=Arthrobotrys flagrans TaxID=97331 RepID=A0A436ZR58_ARTFL|nr:hypothetical protein DFL_009272 [Arthrobotrys flagrans]
MQLFITLAMALNFAGAALAAPQVTRVSVPATAPCVTQFTVTTSYPPSNEPYTTTIYTIMEGIPRDLICQGCSLEVVTETINESRTPDATVTATTATLIYKPMCYDPPQRTPVPKPKAKKVGN